MRRGYLAGALSAAAVLAVAVGVGAVISRHAGAPAPPARPCAQAFADRLAHQEIFTVLPGRVSPGTLEGPSALCLSEGDREVSVAQQRYSNLELPAPVVLTHHRQVAGREGWQDVQLLDRAPPGAAAATGERIGPALCAHRTLDGHRLDLLISFVDQGPTDRPQAWDYDIVVKGDAAEGCPSGGGSAAAGGGSATTTTTKVLYCPAAGEDAPRSGCVTYDGEAAMRENQRYRQELPTDPERLAAATAALPRVRAALAPLIDGSPVTGDEVRDALQRAGFRDWQIDPPPGAGRVSEAVQVAVSVGGACVSGGVGPKKVTLAAHGYIADGGCLAASGH